MNPADFYLCYTRELSEPELDLINAYWEFGGAVDEYKYKTTDFKFNLQNKLIPNLSSNIGKYAYICSKFLSCNKCGDNFKATSRSQLQRLLEKPPEQCSSCSKEEVNEIASRKLDNLETSFSDFNFPIPEDDISFSYLDALYIFIILSLGMDDSAGWIDDPKDLNITGNYEHDMDIFTELLSKNLIHEIDCSAFSNNYFFEENISYLRKYYSSLSHENKKRYDYLCMNMPKFGYYVSLPSEFEDHSILIHFLYQEILTQEISVQDTKQLEALINRTLLHKAYQLIPIVESDHIITIERSLRLETVLLHGVKNFLLSQVFNVLHYQGRLTSADIRSKSTIHRKVHEKLYFNNLEKRLNYLTNIAEDKRFKKTISIEMNHSNIEIFSSSYFLGDVMSWESLSGKEVLRRWVNSFESAD